MWLKAPNINCQHGFSTRLGGISPVPFNSLNLGGSDDEPQNILHNRHHALAELGIKISELSFLKQIHGTSVCEAKAGQLEGDALITTQSDLALAVSIADCYPIIFHDPINNIVAAAHAGWRGTVGKIAANVVDLMQKKGANPSDIQVAIGQGISVKNFEVGEEVIHQFILAGFPSKHLLNKHIDLVACNRLVIENSGVPSQNIWSMNRCTFEDDFFSYRRDKGLTGRMWGLIKANHK